MITGRCYKMKYIASKWQGFSSVLSSIMHHMRFVHSYTVYKIIYFLHIFFPKLSFGNASHAV